MNISHHHVITQHAIPPGAEHLALLIAAGVAAIVPLFVILRTWQNVRDDENTLDNVAGRIAPWGLGGSLLAACALFFAYRESAMYRTILPPFIALLLDLGVLGLVTLLVWELAAWMAFPQAADQAARPRERYIDGARVLDGKKLQAKHARLVAHFRRKHSDHVPSEIRFGGIIMLPKDELEHFLIIGNSGSGKTTALQQTVHDFIERSEGDSKRIMCFDNAGDFRSRFMRKGDHSFNPFLAGSVAWDLFDDVATPYHAQLIAHALIPDGTGNSATWHAAAQDFVACGIEALRRKLAAPTVAQLYTLLCLADVDTQKQTLAGTTAASHYTAGNERLIGSIRFTLITQLNCLRYLRGGAGGFSIRKWVREGTGNLWLPYLAEQIPALKRIYATWAELAIKATLSLPQRDNGLLFLIDELNSLGKIPSLVEAAPELRKFGGRLAIAYQVDSLTVDRYGAGDSKALTENCKSQLLFKGGGGDDNDATARREQNLIGMQRVLREHINYSVGHGSQGGGWGNGSHNQSRNVSWQVQPPQPAVPASEFGRLEPLNGYLRHASWKDWLRIKLPIEDYPQRFEPFTPGALFAEFEAERGSEIKMPEQQQAEYYAAHANDDVRTPGLVGLDSFDMDPSAA